MRRIIEWFVEKRWRRVLLWMVAGLLTVLVLFHQVENWRGARAWADVLELIDREGETLDLEAFRRLASLLRRAPDEPATQP